MQLPRPAFACFALIGAFASFASAQCDPVWRATNPSPSLYTGDAACSLVWDPDASGPAPSRLVVGGTFLAGGYAHYVKLVTFDGTKWGPLDAAAGPGTSGAVAALTVWNGQLIAGGTFTGSGTDRIAAWNGSAWLPIGAGFPVAVTALTVWNGNLVAGGNTSGGAPTLRTWDGTTWTSLPTPPSLRTVRTFASYAGFLCAGGSDANATSGIIDRWNGSAWSASIVATSSSGTATIVALAVRQSLAVGGASTLYAGGRFIAIGGTAANSIAMTSAGGFSWSPVGGNTNSACSALHVRTVGLTSTSVTAAIGSSIHQFSSTTGVWTTIGPNKPATSLTLYGGNYHATLLSAYGACQRYDGTTWAPVAGHGLVGEVRALAPAAGDVVVGGAFVSSSDLPLNRIARWNGTTYEALGTGVTGTSVDALLRRSNGEVVAGGLFSAASGVTANNIARFDGANWATFGTGTNQQVLALCELPNGDLIAGGKFTLAGGVACNRIARWNGSAWSALNFGFNGDVHAVAVRSDGTLFAAGAFTTAGASSCSRIARWDGFVWQALGSGTNGDVHSIAIRPNGDLVAAGAFTSAGGIAVDRCALWNGTAWVSMGAGSGDPTPARSVFVLPNGDVVAGRGFHEPGVNPDTGISRWNGSTWSALGAGVYGQSPASPSVRALAQRADGQLFVGGDFRASQGFLGTDYFAAVEPPCGASAAAYGSGCSSSAGPLSITADNLPWIGSTFRTTTTGVATNSLSLAILGFTPVAVPLPAILPEGQPGCSLLSSLDIALPLTSGPGTAHSTFALTNDPGLVGVPFVQQTIPFEFDLTGAIVAVRGSNALSLVIGMF